MPPTSRREPLRAAPRFTPVDEEAEEGDDAAPRRGLDGPAEPAPRRRSILLGLAVGLAVTVAAVAIAFSIVAVPLFALASIDPGTGLDRDLVRKGLFFVALPFGGIAGTLSGIAVGVWYGRGGRLPRPDLRIHER